MADHDRSSAGPPIKMTLEREVFGNSFVTVYNDDVELFGAHQGQYLRIIESKGQPGVAMLACAGGKYALVQTYRYAVGSWEWGIPRGFAHGTDPAESALEELREELGGPPSELRLLGIVTPNSGLLASRVRVFYAQYDDEISQPMDIAEVHNVRWVGLELLLTEIAAGEIVDAFTLSAVTLALASGVLNIPGAL
jgi:8-oxo-dGTP pyrophosphatase MutT (NUDIX family)